MGKHLTHAPALFHQVRDYLTYDQMTGEFRWSKNTGYRDLIGDKAGRITSRGYVIIQFAGKAYQAHRLAWFFHHGEWPQGIIDHINGSKSDNRMVNLRVATVSQNGMNRGATKGRTLPKGVYFDTRDRCFRASIRRDGITRHLGSFKTADEAGKAYAAASRLIHGEFGRVA